MMLKSRYNSATLNVLSGRGEVFGHVLCAKTFSSSEEAIVLASDTQYGLGGAVISNYLDRFSREFPSISFAPQDGKSYAFIWMTQEFKGTKYWDLDKEYQKLRFSQTAGGDELPVDKFLHLARKVVSDFLDSLDASVAQS